jgi:MFS family permease
MNTLTATETHALQPVPVVKVTKSQTVREAKRNHTIDTINNEANRGPSQTSSGLRTTITVFQLCMINFLSSWTNAVITVGLPTIASSILLPRSLYLWPSSVYSLTSGATLLLAGSVADLLGARQIEIIACILWSVFALACGFANTGIQLVLFRALGGMAMSMHLPASVGLVAAVVPQGKGRNVAFSCLGLSQPLGFSAGLIISGIMTEKVGWRPGFWLAGGSGIMVTVAGMWSLPKPPAVDPSPNGEATVSILRRLWAGVDWIGGLIAAGGLSLLAYVLALFSADLSSIRDAPTVSLLTLSLVLILAFPLWMRRREELGKSALIPNTIWKKGPFTSTCIMVALSNGVINSMEIFSSLYFQEVQNTSALFTSLRLLPNFVIGTLLNLTVGLFIDKVSVIWLVTVSSILCAGAPLLMAVVHPEWSYWYVEFWAQGLSPVSVDILFTVGILIVSDEFLEERQALAGAVFNTASQFGMSLGMGMCQVVTLAVSSRGESFSAETSTNSDSKSRVEQTLKGYQASFWTMFGLMVVCGLVGIGGLRKIGKVGVKRN